MKHFLKCWPEYFAEVKAGRKLFEIRVNDRGYAVGDTLCLEEYDPVGKVYTGDKIDGLEVTYLLDMNRLPGQTKRYSQNMVCMSLRQMRSEQPCDGVKPCPFCGGLVEIVPEGDYVEIVCEDCGIAMNRGSEKWLVADWNKRAGE